MKKLPLLPDVSTLFQIVAIGAGFASAGLLGLSSFWVSPELAAKMSSTLWDSNPAVLESFADQIAYGKAGMFLMVVSTVLQVTTLGLSPVAGRSKALSWVFGLSLVVAIWLGADIWAKRASATMQREAEILQHDQQKL